jgi:ferredoxin
VPSLRRSKWLTKLRLHITFIDKDGNEEIFEVAKGDNLLDIAQANDVEMEGKDSGRSAN